jgi:hypothetical protein
MNKVNIAMNIIQSRLHFYETEMPAVCPAKTLPPRWL